MLKSLIKEFLPPVVIKLYQKIKQNNYGWHGDYSTWEDAQKASTGYDSSIILEKVRSALLKVKAGNAVYERDSVLFDDVQYSWPLLAGLMFGCAKSGGNLKVLDFGGSLGSTYYQNKKFLDLLDYVSWSIVEQKHFVDAGKQDFEDGRLKFFYDIETCIEKEKPNILLLSGVLQYIKNTYTLLDEILKYNFDYIVLDRTPFVDKENDILTCQKVPDIIYSASYPHWFFNYNKMKDYFLTQNYVVIQDFVGNDGMSSWYQFKGLVMRRKNVF